MATSPVAFSKPPRTLAEQVELLVSRGLQVDDRPAAELFLGQVNYYRFVGYGLTFEEWEGEGKRLDRFREGTTFKMLVDLYRWDDALRRLLQGALAEIEIAFRSALCYEVVTAAGDPFWHLNKAYLQADFDLSGLERECVEAVRSSHEPFVKAYLAKYASERVPCWMVVELVSFNKWSKIYGKLRFKEHAKKVATRLKAPPDNLGSWIHSLVVLRNACAHHARLWDKPLSLRPSLTPRMRALNWPQDRLGVLIWIMADLLRPVPAARGRFVADLIALLARCPQPYERPLGLSRIQEALV